MSINRYRLRHRARLNDPSAVRILALLQRPDRLLGLILIGNNCANIFASALATVLAVQLFGERAVIVSTIILTLVVLVFAEVAPKTLAALYPDRLSRLIAWPIYILLSVLYPVVWLLNTMSNGLLRIFGIKLTHHAHEPLSGEELRSIVYETSGRISVEYQNMLLSILDLNNITIKEVIVPKHEIRGINLEDDWQTIYVTLASSEHDWMPVYRENINQIVGVLHLRDLLHEALSEQSIDKDKLMKVLQEPYFIPESTPLNIQLQNFQRQRKRFALVVDEYGEIEGLVTLEAILEEIVGEFTTTVSVTDKIIQKQPDGSYLADGSVTLREFNRFTHWDLPSKGQRTLNGLIVEQLEAIPQSGICIRIGDYPIEIIEVKENRVQMARVFPSLQNN